MQAGPVGIKDVARVAGVSVGTVSNVLNRPDTVSPERRTQVEAAIRELGYIPNDAARQLKAGTSRNIGLLVVDSENPFYGALARGAEAAAEGRALGLFQANSRGIRSREEFYLSQFEQQRVRGILAAPASPDLAAHRGVAGRGTRLVLVDSVDPEADFCTVASDDEEGGYLAVRHLIELGRRRITVIGGPEHFRQVGRRRQGAERAAAEAGGVSLDYVVPVSMTVQAGRAMSDEILSRAEPMPDAIFAMNDLLASGVIQSLVMRRGISVPGDLALVGYDDIDFCEDAVVPISSIRQPSAEMGRSAVELLETEISEQGSHRHRSIRLEPELVVRESTAGRAATATD